jgi:hypothetical protein
MTAPLDYQAFYCEENIWRLAQRGDVLVHRSEVVFIANTAGEVACWYQRAAPLHAPVCWDYHVVLAEAAPSGWRIWDLDTRLGLPCDADRWLDLTFQDPQRVPAQYHPRFRVVPSVEFVENFASDRSHMRSPSGRYRRPPPPWPAPGAGMNLEMWRDMESPGGPGLVCVRADLEARWARPAG